MSKKKLLKDKDIELVFGGEDIRPDVPDPAGRLRMIDCPRCHDKAYYFREFYLETEDKLKYIYRCIRCLSEFYIKEDGTVVYTSGSIL